MLAVRLSSATSPSTSIILYNVVLVYIERYKVLRLPGKFHLIIAIGVNLKSETRAWSENNLEVYSQL